ncbi:MAG TPA: AraC family ligand binding domain-containing protein [Terriglobales bacterium]|nr:AraC family ligand binding domain-containing protein [Terriglobales bacterium]
MKRILPVVAIAAALIGYIAGRATRPSLQPVLTGHLNDFSLIQKAFAQRNAGEARPFGYDNPEDPPIAPDAPPPTHWNIDDIQKAHTELAARAMKAASQAGSGSSQSFGGGPVHVQTRNFSMFMLYRLHRDQPVPSLTKVNSVWDDAEQHAGVYDFYVFTGGTGEMIVGGKIANEQNLKDKDGIIPGEYRGQPIIGGQTFKVKAGDWLLIPPNAPHQPKPDPGGFSYMIIKLNTGVYPWALVR